MTDSGVQGSGSEGEQVAGQEQAAVETKAGGTRCDVHPMMNKGGSGLGHGKIGGNGKGWVKAGGHGGRPTGWGHIQEVAEKHRSGGEQEVR
jgi:hypothetical protein